jgi:lycopene beta-cyclase
MIVPGVLEHTKGKGTRYFKKMGLAFTFANADFKRAIRFRTLSIQHGSRIGFLQSSFEFILNEKNISYVNQKVTDINELENHVFSLKQTATPDTVLIVFTTKPKLKIKPNIPCCNNIL